jgi:hypothetical protein
MEVEYKGYTVRAIAEERDENRWKPRPTVSRAEKGSLKVIPLYGPPELTFKTSEEAEDYALKLAKVWVDSHPNSKS